MSSGWSLAMHRKVAVKRLLMPAELTGPQTEEARRRAVRESRIAAKLAHPHAIGVYDVLKEMFSVPALCVPSDRRARRAS